jgi:hypothetical protein
MDLKLFLFIPANSKRSNKQNKKKLNQQLSTRRPEEGSKGTKAHQNLSKQNCQTP